MTDLEKETLKLLSLLNEMIEHYKLELLKDIEKIKKDFNNNRIEYIDKSKLN